MSSLARRVRGSLGRRPAGGVTGIGPPLLLALALLACHVPPGEPARPVQGSLTDRGLQLFAQDDRSFNAGEVRAHLDALARDVAPDLEGLTTARARVEALNRFFFKERGFRADPDLDDPDNLFPDRVLARRRGYCTGLAWVYAAMAERLGLPVYGVATPQHLFLRYDDATERINIETLEGGREVPDSTYRVRYRIADPSVERGVFLRNLDTDGFLSQLANNLGVLHSRERRFDRSASAYERALRLDPQNPTAHHNLARDRMTQGRLDEAVAGFTQALELNPNDVSALNNRGVCRVRQGDKAGAEADFRAALAIDPGAAEARHNLETVTASSPRE